MVFDTNTYTAIEHSSTDILYLQDTDCYNVMRNEIEHGKQNEIVLSNKHQEIFHGGIRIVYVSHLKLKNI